MFGKIVRIDWIFFGGFKVVEGLFCGPTGKLRFKNCNATLKFENINPKESKTKITYINDYKVNSYLCGEKEWNQIIINNEELAADSEVDYLLVIIPCAMQITAGTTKEIAGKFYSNGKGRILEMHDGDTISVTKTDRREKEVYIAKKIENQMFLIKQD